MYLERIVAVVMPVCNEEKHIELAIKRVPGFVDLIVVIDDGSSDNTWQVLNNIADSRIVKLRHRHNRGVGAATKTGYRYCLEVTVDLIAVMDGDGQMDGSDLCVLLERSLSSVGYVKGNRFLNGESVQRMPPLRYIGNRFFSWLTRRAASFGQSLDAHCGYTVIHSWALKSLLLDELYDGYGFPMEMFFAVSRAGIEVASVPVKTIYGSEVSGINPFTAVPAILFLIARNYIRSKSALSPASGLQRRQPEAIEYQS